MQSNEQVASQNNNIYKFAPNKKYQNMTFLKFQFELFFDIRRSG